MHGDPVALAFIMGMFGVWGLRVVTNFLLQWRRTGSSQELAELRRQVAELARDYQQVKADHTDTLLGLEAGMQRLEARLDALTGVPAAPDSPQAARPPQQRQL